MSGIAHLDGWIVTTSGKKRIKPGIVSRCQVCKARQITVWKGEKGRKA